MPTKPTLSISRWADVGGANLETPPSGVRDTGFIGGTPAISGFVNKLFNQAYAWFSFLDALFSSGGGYTAPVDEDVTVSGTGDFKHGDKPLNIAGTAITATTNNAYLVDGTTVAWAPTGAASGYLSPPLTAGDRITSITFARFGDGAVDLSINVWLTTAAGATSNIGPGGVATVVTNAAAAWTDTTIDVTDTVLAVGESIIVEYTTNAANGRIGNTRFSRDRP